MRMLSLLVLFATLAFASQTWASTPEPSFFGPDSAPATVSYYPPPVLYSVHLETKQPAVPVVDIINECYGKVKALVGGMAEKDVVFGQCLIDQSGGMLVALQRGRTGCSLLAVPAGNVIEAGADSGSLPVSIYGLCVLRFTPD